MGGVPPLVFAGEVSKLTRSQQNMVFTEAHLYFQSLEGMNMQSQIASLSDLFFPNIGLTFGQFALGWLVFCRTRGSTLQTHETPEACAKVNGRLNEIPLNAQNGVNSRSGSENAAKPHKVRR